MGRIVTRSYSQRQRTDKEDRPDDSISSLHLKSTLTGKIGHRRKRMPTRKSASSHASDASLERADKVESQQETSQQETSQQETSFNETSSQESSPEGTSQPEGVSSTSTPDPNNSQVSIEDPCPSNTSTEEKSEMECSICLNKPLHPVKLPCHHIFCYLCIKGVVQSSVGTCALCRAPIPRNFIFSPDVVEESSQSEGEEERTRHTWFYEGRSGGWWEFDARTADDIETKYNEDTDEPKVLELLIAGLIFIIDIDAMVQRRKNAPQIQRRLKRDVKHISDKKGVAGISNKKNPRRPTATHNSSDNREGTPV